MESKQAEAQESPQDYGRSPRAVAARWIDAINLSEREQKKWWGQAEKVIDRYKDERSAYEQGESRFNILWSNVETTKPALFARPPKPVVKRRYKDRDEVGRQAAEIMERALEFCVDSYDFMGECKRGVEDYLLPGRWTERVYYRPVFGPETAEPEPVIPTESGYARQDGTPVEVGQIMVGPQGPMVMGEPYRPVADEYIESEHVHYKDFLHGPARKWSDVPWVAYKTYLRRDELVDRFGEEIGKAIPLDYKPENLSDDGDDNKAEQFKKACVYEIWDREGSQVVWISKGYPDAPLEEAEPHLDLQGFFPSSAPLLAVRTNDSLTPRPEYVMYQDQAREIDNLTARIDKLVDAVKVVGIYAGEHEGIQRMLSEGQENTLIPVPNFAMTGDISKAVDWFPVEQVMKVLSYLYEAREQVKHTLYEVTGMSDLFRGDTQASETATAQRIKSQFGSLRLQDKQRAVQEKIRDILRLKAEVIAEKFSPETLQRMTGVEVTPEVVRLLRDDRMRSFRIDVETDSTIQPDEAEEKAARIEFIQAASQYLGQALQIVEAQPAMGRLAAEMLMWGIRGFHQGRELESVIEDTMDQLNAQPQEQEPSPDLIKAQTEQQEAAAKAQREAAELQIDKVKAADEMRNRRVEQAATEREIAVKEREQALREWEAQQKYGGEAKKLLLDEFRAQMEYERDQTERREAQGEAEISQALSELMESVRDISANVERLRREDDNAVQEG